MKKWLRSSISLLLAVVMIVGSAPFVRAETEGVDLTDGLLAHYDFETVSGTTVSNKANADTYPGTLSGSAAVTDLDGANQLGNSLQLGSAAGGMQLTDIVDASASSFSVSLWYKASATSSSNVNLVQAGTIGGSTGRTILILNPESKYYTYLTGDNSNVKTAAVNPTAWQHVIFAYDQANSKAYFYVNGVADNADGVSLSGTALSTGNMIIGRHRNDNEGQFNGLIDEVRVYNKVLSGDEAKAIFDTTDAIVNPPAAPVESIELTVDINDTQRIIDSDSIFGINHRYAFNGYGSFDSATMQIKDDFRALYEDAGFGSIRYPGGTISNLFNWKTAIGPVEQRKDQIHGFYNNSGQGGIAPNFGLAEIGTFAESVGSEIVYVYSLGRGSAQDAADLIEYLNAKVGTNPNGGIDWAAVRAANGHEAPYNVRYFEIGNEMQQAWEGSDGTASQGYWTTAVSGGAETAYIDGGVATFTKQYAVCEEDWNAVASRSDGSANMVRYMRYANANPKMYDDKGNIVDDPSFVAVQEDSVSVFVGQTQWTIVDSFENSGASDTHVVIDYSTGAIKFGDGQKGAIPESGSQIYVSYCVDRDGFIDVSKAIKETTAAINASENAAQEAYVYSSFETTGFLDKMEERNAVDLYDGLTIHPYSGDPGGDGDSFYDSAMKKAEDVGIARVQEFVDMMPEDKVPVISEYGIFRSTDPLVRSQTHAVYIAKVLMEYVRLGSPYIQKHCLVDWYSSGADSLGPTQQAVIQAVAGSDADTKTGEGTFTFFSTPSAHVFKMMNTAFGDTVISSEFNTVPTMDNGAKTLSALASTDDEGNVYVAIVNASREEDYSIALNLENLDCTGAEATVYVLTADSYDAQNSPENPDNVDVTEATVAMDANAISYTVPKHSFLIVKVDPAEAIPTEPEETQPEETEPEGTQPEETEPEETQPEETKPEETEPEETKPEETEPEETQPEETKPQVPECDKDENCILSQFADIKVDAWYHDGIHFCVEEGIMNGMGEGKFAPDEPTTRAQMVIMLYRLAGQPSVKGMSEPFTDVEEGDWFYDSIVWAYNDKVVNGTTETTFEPDTNVSREQVAAILHRYLDTPAGTGKLDTYPDVGKVQSYAKDALVWAVGEGVINGVAQPDGTSNLDPAGNATRAQIATILMRYLTAK